MGSCSRRVERGDGWSLHQEKAIRNGEKKLNQYQQEFSKWQEKDRDSTINAFQRSFVTITKENPKEKGEFSVESRARQGYASFTNKININKGEIIGESNFKRLTKGWHLSEVVFNQLQLVLQEAKKDMASFDFKNWRGERIINELTRSTVNLFLPEGTTRHTFEKGSEGFLALAGTPTAQSKFYLVAQHQKVFGKKEVTSITVERQVYQHSSTINIIYNYG
jgi:hypothetical protein